MKSTSSSCLINRYFGILKKFKENPEQVTSSEALLLASDAIGALVDTELTLDDTELALAALLESNPDADEETISSFAFYGDNGFK